MRRHDCHFQAQPRLVASRLRRYYAEKLGLLVPDFLCIFFFLPFFFFSNRPTQNQEMHSTVNEKKRKDSPTSSEELERLPLNGIFGNFSGQTVLHFFALRKRNRLNRMI